MSTRTPIPYWLSLPWGEVCEWAGTVGEINKERGDG